MTYKERLRERNGYAKWRHSLGNLFDDEDDAPLPELRNSWIDCYNLYYSSPLMYSYVISNVIS